MAGKGGTWSNGAFIPAGEQSKTVAVGGGIDVTVSADKKRISFANGTEVYLGELTSDQKLSIESAIFDYAAGRKTRTQLRREAEKRDPDLYPDREYRSIRTTMRGKLGGAATKQEERYRSQKLFSDKLWEVVDKLPRRKKGK